MNDFDETGSLIVGVVVVVVSGGGSLTLEGKNYYGIKNVVALPRPVAPPAGVVSFYPNYLGTIANISTKHFSIANTGILRLKRLFFFFVEIFCRLLLLVFSFKLLLVLYASFTSLGFVTLRLLCSFRVFVSFRLKLGISIGYLLLLLLLFLDLHGNE